MDADVSFEPVTPGSYGEAPAGYRLPATVRLGAVRLQVSDLEQSAAWYQRVLGLRIIEHDGSVVTLGAASGPTLVRLEHHKGTRPVRPGSRLGLYHVALLLPDRESLGRFLRHLASEGVRPGASDHGVSEALYLQDPDGLGMEIYADRRPERWQRQGRELIMVSDPLDLPAVFAAAGGERWTGMPGHTTVGHVHLHVGSLAEASAFYHDAIGFDRMVWRHEGALFLAAGGYHHHLGINSWASGAPVADQQDAKLLEWSLVLPTVDDAAALANAVAGAGYQVRRDNDDVLVADRWGATLRVTAAA